MSRPLFALPSRSDLKVTCAIAGLFIIVFYSFYGATAYLADLLPYKFNLNLKWERNIPFLPETAIVYTSMNWMMVLSLFIIRDKCNIWFLFKILCIQIIISSVVYMLFPVANILPEISDDLHLPMIYIIADAMNLHNNNFPSLHVCFAVTMAGIFSQYANRWQACLFHTWALTIAISTLTIHAHGVFDILAGYLLGSWGVNRWKNKIAFNDFSESLFHLKQK